MAPLENDTERPFRALADHAPDPIVRLDRELRTLYVNPAFERVTGRPAAHFLGRNIFEVGAPAGIPEMVESAARGATERRAVTTARYRSPRSGREFEVRAAPELGPDGAAVSSVLVIRDVSADARLREQLQAAVAARDAFISVASHELKSPLTALALQLQLLAREAQCDPRATTRLESCSRAVSRLKGLVRSLLDASQIDAGRLVLERVELDLAEVAREASERMAEALREAGCRLTARLSPTPGFLDRSRCDQVIVNLLSNAIKYAPGCAIELRVAPDGERGIIELRDHGPGIPEDVRERIFQRFERGPVPRHVGGLGLGLFIVREIAAAHGGGARAEVPRDGGAGAAFVVELPLAPPGPDPRA